MDAELTRVFETLTRAMSPEDVFGLLVPDPGEPPAKALEAVFHRLARGCHPDRFHEDAEAREVAQEAFQRLSSLRERAALKLERGTYGTPGGDEEPDEASVEIKTARRTYRIGTTPFAEGDIAVLYRGVALGGEGPEAQVVAKVTREAADNDLIRNEARVLTRLWLTPSPQLKHLPVLLDPFKSEDRQGLVLREIDALDGATLRERLPAGSSPEHAGWILQRLLSVLGFAHAKGVVHGNVEPEHVLVRPRDHNVFLVDWCWAAIEPAKTGEGFRTSNELYGAPEAAERRPPTPASDLYSAGKTMITLLGGDPAMGSLPPSVPDRMARLLTFLTLPSPRGRAQDAWETHREAGLMRQELFGEKKFVEFRV